MTPPEREQLLAHLVKERIAGDVGTPRRSNLANIDKMLRREWDYWFGLELEREWTFEEVLSVMAERCGISADAGVTSGPDRIDPELTVTGLDRAAELLASVAADKGSVFVATGHPTGLLPVHLAIASTLAAAGCRVLTPAAETWVEMSADHPPSRRMRIRYLYDVAMLTNGADFLHTHAAEPMQLVLETLTEEPALVVADHGWAGAAAQAGLPTIGFADSNDPALFVGAAEGKVAAVVPLDDNVPPAAYAPVTAYLLGRLR